MVPKLRASLKAFFNGDHRRAEAQTKDRLLNRNWMDFLTWCSDVRSHTGMGIHYEHYTVAGNNGVARKIPIANEANFWFWWLEYRHEGVLDANRKATSGRGA